MAKTRYNIVDPDTGVRKIAIDHGPSTVKDAQDKVIEKSKCKARVIVEGETPKPKKPKK